MSDNQKMLYNAAFQNAGWFANCTRYGNLTWVESDPHKYDIDWWIDFCKRTHTDVVTLSVGGIVAYYPTQIPLHHKAKWLGDRDMVGEFITRCRENNIYVIARIDPHAFHEDMAQAHPEWIFVNENGEKRRHWDNPELWVACTHGKYVFDYMTDIIHEIMTMYMPDAVFSNRYGGSGICYCENCKREFKEATGYDLVPEELNNLNSPLRAAYNRWNEKKLFERWEHWDAVVKSYNPNGFFSPNAGGDTMKMMNLKELGKRAERINVDRQGRSAALDPMWSIGREGRIFRSVFGNKPIAGGYSVGPEWRYRWKDATQSIAELRMFYATGLASGMHPSWGKFSGKLYDTRWVEPIVDMFQWHHRNEKYLKNTDSLAKAAILHTQQRTWKMDGKNEQDFSDDFEKGMYHAFVESRIPVDLINKELLSDQALAPYALLALPNTVQLDDEKCEIIRRFVAKGGKLISTYQTSLYDEQGRARSNFGLSDVFGADYVEPIPGPMRNSYVNIETQTNGKYHPIVHGLEDATRIINGVWQLKVSENCRLDTVPLTLVPGYPSLPMEDCYPRQERTDIPWVYMHEFGSGYSVYFPWDLDRTFWETLNYDHLKVLQNTFRWLMGEQNLVSVEGCGMVEVSAWEQANSMTVHIINDTNPMMWKGPYRELLPLNGQRAVIQLPKNKKAASAKLLVSGAVLQVEPGQTALEVELPAILDHEIIAIDYL